MRPRTAIELEWQSGDNWKFSGQPFPTFSSLSNCLLVELPSPRQRGGLNLRILAPRQVPCSFLHPTLGPSDHTILPHSANFTPKPQS
ncbi:hypothetical protein B0H10DRAFT_1991595 [Mycena sp. CBHHK59/15]|nr:hypothetical protein B0H10DRAFT_1991595 [Mycena sp. CBHHK59/15]